MIVNLCIILALFLWIPSTFGYGILGIKILQHFALKLGFHQRFIKSVDLKFNLLLKGIVGIATLSIIVQFLHFFTAINHYVSIIFLLFGLLYFMKSFKQEISFIKQQTPYFLPLILALLTGFILASILSIRVESAYDTGLYHIQAIKWIQEYPIIFGIANIHTRFGFNNILYNFAALTEVSHIFPSIRSFLLGEIFAFFFFTSTFLSLCALRAKLLNDIFMCVSFIIISINFWWLGGGMYAEGILGILGLSLVAYIIFMIEKSLTHTFLAFVLLFVMAFFSIYIKISAFFLLVCALLLYFQYHRYSLTSLKNCIYICGFCVILGIFWALKGICISGMIAYPAKVGYLGFLPWVIDESRRAGEVLGIHNWAKVAGSPDREVLLQDYSWIKVWFKLFFWNGTFKMLLQLSFYACGFLLLLLIMRRIYFTQLKPYVFIFLGLILGIVFWFISAPDPRFGFQYFFPVFAFSASFVLQYFLSHKEHYVLGLCFLYICASLSVNHIHFNAIDRKESQKIPQVALASKHTDSNLLIYYPKEGDRVYDAPLPAAAYFNSKLSKKTFLGRDMYVIESHKGKKEHQ